MVEPAIADFVGNLRTSSVVRPHRPNRYHVSVFSEGYWSSTERCFDIGMTVRAALHVIGTPATPIAGPTDPPSGTAASCDWRQCRLFFFPDEALGEKYWAKSCLTADGGRNVWTTLVCWRACWSAPRQDAVRALSSLWSRNAHLVTSSRAPLTREHFGKGESDIRGSGYVVEFGGGLLVLFRRRISKQQFSEPQSLVMMRIRPRQHLLYSRLYGESAIPDKWLTRLYLPERIRDVADALYSLSGAGRVRKVNALQRPRRASADADDRERVTRPICPLAHGGPA